MISAGLSMTPSGRNFIISVYRGGERVNVSLSPLDARALAMAIVAALEEAGQEAG